MPRDGLKAAGEQRHLHPGNLGNNSARQDWGFALRGLIIEIQSVVKRFCFFTLTHPPLFC